MKIALCAVCLAFLVGCSSEDETRAIPPQAPMGEARAIPPQPVTPEAQAPPAPAAQIAPTPPAADPVVVDVPAIAGKRPAQVAAILGTPTATETIRSHGKPLPKRIYRNGDVEVVYVDGKADWITVFGQGQLPFGPEVLSALGLPSTPPSFFNPLGVIRWERISGLRTVSVFPNPDGHAHYAYILVNTSP